MTISKEATIKKAGSRLTVTAGLYEGEYGKLISMCHGKMAEWAGVMLDGRTFPLFIKRSDIEFTEGGEK